MSLRHLFQRIHQLSTGGDQPFRHTGGEVGGPGFVAALFIARIHGIISLSAVDQTAGHDEHFGGGLTGGDSVLGEGLAAVAHKADLADAENLNGNPLEKAFLADLGDSVHLGLIPHFQFDLARIQLTLQFHAFIETLNARGIGGNK